MRISFITFGCKLNQAETEIFKNKLFNKGLEVVPENRVANSSAVARRAKADFFLINACAVTVKAEKEMRQKINQIKRRWPKSFLIITGCYLPQENNKVDLWIKRDKLIEYLSNRVIRKINNIRNSSEFARQKVASQPFIRQKITHLGGPAIIQSFGRGRVRHNSAEGGFGRIIRREASRTRSYVKIQDGCNNYCSYCIVPFLRGKSKNRPWQKIISEIKKKERQGYKEIVLVGTDLKKVNPEPCRVQGCPAPRVVQGKSLTDLLKIILKGTNISRIRISSLWPTALTPELIELVRKEPRICPHFHLSIQSGCDKILSKMSRNYRIAEVKKIIKKALRIPNLNLTADFIVGFPSETERDFLETYNFIKSLPFLRLHIFRYSPRPMTSAAQLTDQVASGIKRKRSQEVIALGRKLSRQVRKKYLGRIFAVLFEEKKDSFWNGLTANYLRIYVRSRNKLNNRILNVKLLRLYKDGIYGVLNTKETNKNTKITKTFN